MRNALKAGLAFLLATVAGCKIQPTPFYLEDNYYGNQYVTEARGRIFQNFHGLHVRPDLILLEGEGTSLFVQQVKLDTTDKYFERLRKQYIHDGSLDKTNVPWLKGPNRIFGEYKIAREELERAYRLYTFPMKDHLVLVGIKGYNLQDTARWDRWVKTIAEEGLPEYVITSANPSSVDFAGRMLDISPGCVWVEPHNLRCPGKGQMDWSLYPTAEEAKEKLQQQMYYTRTFEGAELQEDTEQEVLFEGVPVTARKMVYRLKMSPLLLGSSNVLIIYYVTTEVRGHYMHCVMSFYDTDASPGGLAPLIQKVMTLP
ncbi:MAG TPA: hypothetical protein DCG19_14940 [Cryomorphaceae bacterium]|nr:hypothetical protein [Owenweeksia sp.]MBG00486.1 hypothetical protein [Owenweeksia sp.]HAD98706.1 hypothetical protein [Cryomorphaceae bacterium]HBF19489.1 hypothetical protein [Cryomorphaceae bacterium]|tara:strand:+ start:196 stop:1137 length:942 start_codon:yes stop_codon:yes gene_type:complete